MRDLAVLGGTSHPTLTKDICRNLVIEQGDVNLRRFSNGETSVEIQGSVREKDVFIVQSGCGDVNDNFIELLIMIAACKTASAKRVTAVLPLFPYSRQPDAPHAAYLTGAPSISTKKEKYTFESAPGTPRPLSRNDSEKSTVTNETSNFSEPALNPSANLLTKATHNNLTQPVATRMFSPEKSPLLYTKHLSPSIPLLPSDVPGRSDSGYKQWIAQNGTLIANLLTTAGADRCITMDLHDPQFQGFFDIPVDNLYLKPLIKNFIIRDIPNYQDCVIVSPDSGGAKRATSIADALGCSFALIHKERRARIDASQSLSANGPSTTMVATTMLVGEVKDRICVIIDDLVDTSYTITRAAKLLKDQGAKYVYALATHGVLSGDSVNRINKSAIDKFVVTNTTPQMDNAASLGKKFEVLDVSRILAEAIRRIHNGESVSMLFDHGWRS